MGPSRRWSLLSAMVAGLVLVPLLWPRGGPAQAAIRGTNLLSGATSTFDGSIGTWSCLGTCGLSDATSPVYAGSGSLAVQQTGAAGSNEWLGSGTGPTSWVVAVPGAVYSGGGYVHAGTVSRALAAIVLFYDAGGNLVGSSFGPAMKDDSSWRPIPVAAGLAPASTSFVALGFIVGGAASGERTYFDNAWLSTRPVGSPAIAGPLSTDGNAIQDSQGRKIVLRGLTRIGSETGYNFPTGAEIAEAKAWGANIVRVPLGEQQWLNTCPTGRPTNDPAYPASVDSEVASITGRGMVALLDLHFNVISPCGAAGPHMAPDASYSVPFWRQVASRYRYNPLVAFDLYNEPHDITDAVWRNGGFVWENSTLFNAAGMQQLYDTVRSQAAYNLVFVSGPDWASRPPLLPVTGYNIVNAAHVYNCETSPPPACATPDPTNPAPVLDNWLAVSAFSPVMITEFGWPDRDDPTFNGNVIAFAEGQGWGWSTFAWDGGTAGLFDLLANSGATYEPAPAGQPVLLGLGANTPS